MAAVAVAVVAALSLARAAIALLRVKRGLQGITEMDQSAPQAQPFHDMLVASNGFEREAAMRRAIATVAFLALLGGLPFFVATAAPAGKETDDKKGPSTPCMWPKISAAGPEAFYGRAVEGAISAWQQQATNSAGPAFGTWSRSARRDMACQKSGHPLRRQFVCTATALPCS